MQHCPVKLILCVELRERVTGEDLEKFSLLDSGASTAVEKRSHCVAIERKRFYVSAFGTEEQPGGVGLSFP